MEREDFSFEAAGLYVHVPFCAHHCRYCNFVVTTENGDAAHRRFIDAVSLESALYAPHLRGKKLETLYFGGGTPSRLSASEFSNLMEMLRRNFEWTAHPEITLEANPDDLVGARLIAPLPEAWLAAGVTRVSLGAQSFREETLKTADRSHTAAQITEAVLRLREAGFKNLNLDLILSMPGESTQDVKGSVKKLIELSPEHVSLYELVVEPRTVFAKWKSEGKLPLAPEAEQVEMLKLARAMLKDAGYRHYELLNFAKPGFESRHNLLYWANRGYLGLGPGAFSYLDGRRFRLARTVDEYYKKIESRDWTPCEEETLSSERRLVESFLLALRLAEGASAVRFSGVIQSKSKEITKLVDQQLIFSDDKGVRLTERGKLFAETVFAELA